METPDSLVFANKYNPRNGVFRNDIIDSLVVETDSGKTTYVPAVMYTKNNSTDLYSDGEGGHIARTFVKLTNVRDWTNQDVMPKNCKYVTVTYNLPKGEINKESSFGIFDRSDAPLNTIALRGFDNSEIKKAELYYSGRKYTPVGKTTFSSVLEKGQSK